ncbi:glycosyltransferase [Fictibacillus aquaticus]|uniref:Spore protein YkvP/CgeB glycosyl transferase-like domain-containing protein n=1 Tax=Fictibacillus aquaticus TaxID=2021314 RepID=A0A235FE59_9BACL|nr:glycosyltransferase [Fictibacillus aquaticus]OYD59045.1 hypothetical protein CGZ90_03845 [Fictibacillus aquaticus]
MKKINLLFITRDHSHQLERSSFYLAKELEKITNLYLWYSDGIIQDILNQIPFKPDFILLNDYKPDYRPFIRGLKDLTIPHGIIMHDMHYKLSKRNYLIHQEKPALIFSHYRDAFLKWFPDHSERLVWFPHHVPAEIFKRYPVPKEIPFLLMGASFPHLYPFRDYMIKQFSNVSGFVHHSHPGYGMGRRGIVGEQYARLISSAKIFLTCDSIHHFPVLKYFEVPACGTLLLASSSQELTDLGFVDGETFVAVNEANVKAKAEYYLQNEQERERIIQNGMRLIAERHTTAVRAKEMLHAITHYLSNRK